MNSTPLIRFALTAVLLTWAAPVTAHAIGSIYAQGHGGVGGEETSEILPGRPEPALGPALGLQGGLRLLVFEGYVDRTAFDQGHVTRGVLGLRPTVALGGARLVLRAGAGLLSDQGALLIGSEGDAWTGPCARLGGGAEFDLSPFLRLGLGLDGEVFALSRSSAPSSDEIVGSDVFGSLYLAFEFGI